MKYITKTYFYHLIPRTEYFFIFEKKKIHCSPVLYVERGLKRGFGSKAQPYAGLIEEISYKNIFLSPVNRDRGWFHL